MTKAHDDEKPAKETKAEALTDKERIADLEKKVAKLYEALKHERPGSYL